MSLDKKYMATCRRYIAARSKVKEASHFTFAAQRCANFFAFPSRLVLTL